MSRTSCSITANTLASLLQDTEELALLDVREEGVFALGHLLFAVPASLSRLEERIGLLVPRLNTRIVLVGDDDLVIRGVDVLSALGYTDLSYLDGGLQAWAGAGYELISGVNVPSKLFGEWIEARYATPHIDPHELQAMRDAGRDVLVVDARPSDEFNNVSIPGALNCPGVELVHRLPGYVKSKDTLVVVNCAGRTRSIIGCQTLINAGLENPVVALRNGTIGWHLAGLKVAHGKTDEVPLPAGGSDVGRSISNRFAERFEVKPIDADTLRDHERDRHIRTLYVFDVRSKAEYEAGHLPGSVWAPGGQLVQATDQFMATRHARVVLIGDDSARATVTASWLEQMGWSHVFIYRPAESLLCERGPGLKCGQVPEPLSQDTLITPVELSSALESPGTLLIDLASSVNFRTCHIPGAHFAIRARLKKSLEQLDKPSMIVLTSEDGSLALHAAREVNDILDMEPRVLAGGTQSWTALGLPVEQGMAPALDPPEDLWYRPTSPHGGGVSAMRQYISWELALYEKLLSEPGLAFRKPYPERACAQP